MYMENKNFSFGKVKGMNMVEVMNMETIHAQLFRITIFMGTVQKKYK